jgi:hypothetical protein
MRGSWLILPLVVALSGCGAHDEKHAGEATIVGTVQGLELATDHGVSIARMFPPTTEVKVSPSGVACEETQAGDRITFDLGDEKPGLYTVVVGYPSKADLSAAQARAHVCPAKPEGGEQPPCHDVVRSGEVTVTRFDSNKGGRVEGSCKLELADGSVSGTFSAYRCD